MSDTPDDAQVVALIEENRRLHHMLHNAGMAELCARNPNVASYMREWEARATAAFYEDMETVKQFDAIIAAAERCRGEIIRRQLASELKAYHASRPSTPTHSVAA